MTREEYQAEYFQRMKTTPRYKKKLEQNKKYNESKGRRKWKNAYMLNWYYDHKEQVSKQRKIAYRKKKDIAALKEAMGEGK